MSPRHGAGGGAGGAGQVPLQRRGVRGADRAALRPGHGGEADIVLVSKLGLDIVQAGEDVTGAQQL